MQITLRTREAPRTLAQSWPVRLLRHLLEASVALVVASYAAVICAQVFYRYVLNASLIWSEELVRYGLLWGVMIGAALASDRNAHIALDPLRRVAPPRVRLALLWTSGALILVFCAVAGWYGWEYAYRLRTMSSPAIRLPMIWVYLSIPVGSGLIAIFTLVHLVSGSYGSGAHEEGPE